MRKFIWISILLSSILAIFFAHGSELEILVPLESKERFIYTGKSILRGINLAQMKLDPKKTVKLTTLQFTEKPEDVYKTVEAQIQKRKPDMIVGGITSKVALVISDLAERYKIPYVAPYATHEKVTEDKEFTFRACFDDLSQAKAIANFMLNNLKAKKMALISSKTSIYAKGLVKSVQEELRKTSKIEVRIFKSLGSKGKLNVDITQRLRKFTPDVVFLPYFQVEAAGLLTQLAPLMPRTTFLGSDAWAGGQLFHDIIKDLGEENFNAYYTKHYYKMSKGKANKEFRQLYKNVSTSNKEDLYFINATALGFDAGLIAFSAIVTNKNGPSLVEKIWKVKVDGATGSINYEKQGTPIKDIHFYKIGAGKDSYVAGSR